MYENIHIKPVTKANFIDCIHLELPLEQRHNLASNAVTIAESRFKPHYQLRAIYLGEKVIGMLAFCHEDEPEDFSIYWLFRMMLDRKFQNLGFSKLILKLVIDEVRILGAKKLFTMCKPSNLQSLQACKNFGFKQIGYLDDGDIHLSLDIE